MVNKSDPRKKTQPKIVRSGEVKMIDTELVMQHGGDFFFTESMMSGCRGKFIMPSNPVYKVWDTQYPHLQQKCRLLHHGNPFLKLTPFKMEVASVVPFMIVVHEVLTDADADHLVELSRPLLSRSRGAESKPASQRQANRGGKNRVVHKSVQVWLNDTVYHDNPHEYRPDNITINDQRMWTVYKRMELAFNIDVKSQWSSHQSQVTNYGIGGLCEQHLDSQGFFDGSSARNDQENRGDYIATIMAWLGNTPSGGVTSFFRSQAEALVYPTKGSAAFWWDIYHYGGRDQGTAHGGCPVAMGTKWILNKWVYSHNQWNRYPCRLTMQEAMFPYPHQDNIGPFQENRFF